MSLHSKDWWGIAHFVKSIITMFLEYFENDDNSSPKTDKTQIKVCDPVEDGAEPQNGN